MNFSDIASNISSDATAFKKIQYFSKTNPQSLFSDSAEYNSRYNKLANLYFNDLSNTKTSSYGTFRQHNYASVKSVNNGFYSKMENKTINQFLQYNTALNQNKTNLTKSSFNDFSDIKTYGRNSELNSSLKLRELANSLSVSNQLSTTTNLLDKFLKYTDKSLFLNSETDGKQISNALKYSLWGKYSKKNLLGKTWSNVNLDITDLSNNSPMNKLTSQMQNSNLYYRFKDLKSGNMSYLTNERNVRLIDNVPTQKTNLNLTSSQNNLNSLIRNNLTSNISNSSKSLFLNSALNWNNMNTIKYLSASGTKFTQSHVPLQSNNPNWDNLGYTKYTNNNDSTPDLMKSKEESAPTYLFNSY